ncbi:MAG TPA: hypothetical protein PLO16_15165, partial [Acidocella sp.]|nr:hypothetical protein [Acidocella sp.]
NQKTAQHHKLTRSLADAYEHSSKNRTKNGVKSHQSTAVPRAIAAQRKMPGQARHFVSLP